MLWLGYNSNAVLPFRCPYNKGMRWLFLLVTLTASALAYAQQQIPGPPDSYDVLLHSKSIAHQRTALEAVLHSPEKYIPRIQQSLRGYPRLLRTDPAAANRAVYISALLRDPTFPPLLVKQLGNAKVLEECMYPCPVVFALTVQAGFAGWMLPTNLDSQLTTVDDLRSSIRNLSHLNLKVGSIEDAVQGPILEEHRKELEGKNEEQLIQMAGPTSKSYEIRVLAACRLETLIADSRNRVELYLLALNEIRDNSGEYRDALYQAIYRAELAKARSESVAPTR
jgi:hypothetical protein